MNFIKNLIPAGLLLGWLFFGAIPGGWAQGKLDKKISISIRQKPLSQALTEIGRKGGFVFSYNTTILNGDGVVDVRAGEMSIRQILDRLLGGNYEYVENGKYVIILQRPNAPPNVPPVRLYTISGYVKDEATRAKMENVSVYESDQLVSTLTDTNGFFRLRLKEKYTHAMLVISKQFYRDTVLFIRPGYDQQLTIPITREKISDLAPFVVSNRVEKTWLGKFFLSSRAIVQSLNLMNFFADKPIQCSLIPGLGTHGRMGSQVVNKFSCNVIGGYTAGMNGLELAGVFNIDRKAVRYVQAAGVFNVVGGQVHGVQLAGVHNHDLDSVHGVQAAGVSNVVKGEMRGLQVSGVVNYAKRLKGVQIGLVNIADTSSGFMIGLVNIVKNGIHEFTLSSNEMLPLNISYKTGSRKMYSILQLGFDPAGNEKAYAYGIGIGNELGLSSRLALNTELALISFLVGHDRNLPEVVRLQTLMRVKLGKNISLFAGPALSLTSPNKTLLPDGYKTVLPRAGYHTFAIGNNVMAWVGWSAGINIF